VRHKFLRLKIWSRLKATAQAFTQAPGNPCGLHEPVTNLGWLDNGNKVVAASSVELSPDFRGIPVHWGMDVSSMAKTARSFARKQSTPNGGLAYNCAFLNRGTHARH
jgi:hypothetical protein